MPELQGLHLVEAGRAKHASTSVEAGLKSASKAKEFAASCKKLPMLVKINGLVPALLFAQEKKQFGSLHTTVLDWLNTESCPVSQIMQGKDTKSLTHLTSADYQVITAEVQRYLAWVKRFASALHVPEKSARNGE